MNAYYTWFVDEGADASNTGSAGNGRKWKPNWEACWLHEESWVCDWAEQSLPLPMLLCHWKLIQRPTFCTLLIYALLHYICYYSISPFFSSSHASDDQCKYCYYLLIKSRVQTTTQHSSEMHHQINISFLNNFTENKPRIHKNIDFSDVMVFHSDLGFV